MGHLADCRPQSISLRPDQTGQGLWLVSIFTDLQAISADCSALGRVMQAVQRLPYGPAGLVLFESSLPAVRSLAMLLASMQANPSAVASCAADWLAARAWLLGWSHVALPGPDGAALLQAANQHLTRLATLTGLPAVSLRRLSPGFPVENAQFLMRAGLLADLPPTASQLGERVRLRMQALQAVLGLL